MTIQGNQTAISSKTRVRCLMPSWLKDYNWKGNRKEYSGIEN